MWQFPFAKIFLAGIVLIQVSFSATAQDFSKVDRWLDDHTPEMGGRSVLVIYRDGRLVYTHVSNNLNLRQKFAINMIARRQNKEGDTHDFTPDSREPIASCSKWYSAALIMTFVDEGKLKLSDSVGKFLPILTQHGKGAITISQCLSHTTAIKAPPLRNNIEEVTSSNSMDEAIEKISREEMEGEPGKIFHYSNTGLQIAGAIIEKISGKSFGQLFAERIAQPLNMKNSDFGKGKIALPAGGAYSTPMDYLHFLEMILNRGLYNGKRILSETAIREMQINRVTSDVKIASSPAEAGKMGYGYGEWVMEGTTNGIGSRTVTSPGLFGSFPWVDNEKKYCAFLLCYYIKPDGRGDRYKQLKSLVDAAIAP